MATNEWEEFFRGHAPVYMQNVFTKNTLAEVDFILEEMKLPVGSSILDIGCGTGRHSVELAKRGYKMTGVDLSPDMLNEAKRAAQEAGVQVEWVQSDASKYQADKAYNGAICLCEGAFCLLGSGDDPIERDMIILRNIHSALKPGAPFILTALSAFRMIRSISQSDVENGKWDPITSTETMNMELDSPEGKKSVVVRERTYVPAEIQLMLRQTGFYVKNVWGGTAGNWGRRQIDLDEYEMMVVARKT